MTVASEGLKRHYDAKYAFEAAGGSVERIECPAIPTDRFEAC